MNYKWIIPIVFLLAIQINASGQTLHSIVIADTYDKQLEGPCFSDKETVLAELATISQVLNLKHSNKEIQGEEFKIENIISSISNISCSNNDVLFFYYTGHGARSKVNNSKWPQMSINLYDIDDKSEYYLSLQKVIELLEAKKPRLLIVVADCCNNISNVVLPDISVKGQTTVKDDNKLTEVYKNLFLKPKGKVIVSSSGPGQFSIAYADQASVFTLNYFKSIAAALNGNIKANWTSVLEISKTLTSKQASLAGQNQTPQYEINISNNINPTPPKPKKDLIASINSLVDKQKSPSQRLRLISSVLKTAFSDENALVETYAKDSKTLVERETAKEFIMRLATSSAVVKVIELKSKKNTNGKFKKLTTYEIIKL